MTTSSKTIINLSEIVSPVFSVPHIGLKTGQFNQVVSKGGRGSAKSSWASIEGVLLIVKHPEIHGVVLRKVANTLRTSVYAQYVWAVQALGLTNQFKCTVSPMEIIYKRTGQKIMFFGADDPGKIKSIKVPFGYIGYLHFEELDQFSGEEEIRNIEQSTLRGGSKAFEIKTFNPPKTMENWANKYCLKDKPGQLIHTSNYLSTPVDWLGQRFIEDAEYLRDTNYDAYEHEYLGISNGIGGLVFDRIETQTITHERMKQFDRIYQGVDWGWYPDPFAFIRLHYDKNRETIFVLDEYGANKKSNEDTAGWIKKKRYHDVRTICDSAEPKSVIDFQNLGIRSDGAIKGPGSVEHGMKWLQRRKIVFDPKRTPKAYKEFLEYEYERDKEGNVITGYPDSKNHFIDATRYALERLMLSNKTTA